MRPTGYQYRRVVVTGLGAVTPLGHTVEDFWDNLCAGRSGVGPISLFDASNFRTRIAAEVRAFEPPEAIGERRARRMDRFALFAVTAALEAWRDACLSRSTIDPYSIGVIIGSSHGGEGTLLGEAAGVLDGTAHTVSSWLIPRMLSNMASAQVAIQLGLRGPSFTIASACATGAHTIGEAAELIRRGDAEVMLCGGAEACITPLTLAGDQAAGALSGRNDSPDRASRPFDADRDGFVLGEGAGVLALEAREHALARKASIYAEVVGYGATTDALHETHPDPSGTPAARAIQRALAKAGCSPQDLDGIFAHATGTPVGDRAEARALSVALGETLGLIPVTAIKSAVGHLLGASAAVQAIATVKALQSQTLPPTRNLDTPDPACPLTIVVGGAQPGRLRSLLSTSFGFGGHNAALVFRAEDDAHLEK